MSLRAGCAAIALVAACVTAPAPVDVAALLARRGPVEARRDLAIAVLASPRDIGARLALAKLDVQLGRPSDAIDQLEAVIGQGGPLGTRWHDDDRARYAQLLLARGQDRLARGSASALGDLEGARHYGAVVPDDAILRAKVAAALAELHHVDAGERAKGREALAAAIADPAARTSADAAVWRGARAVATPAERGAFGSWLWQLGARREAYEQLAAWHAATPAPRDEALQGAYLRALAWWSPVWFGAPGPAPDELVGPERCWFPVAACALPERAEPPLPAAPAAPIADPYASAVAHYAASRPADEPRLVAAAGAYRRDPMIAERLGRDFVAESVDAAAAHATIGRLFDALGDPARARTEWQAAVDGDPMPPHQRGLAEAAARAGDGPAAIVFATAAAAGWGDPAIVWSSTARALDDAGLHVDALEAARSAIDLAGPEAITSALEVAIAASRALGRTSQVDTLTTQRDLVSPRVTHGDPTDPVAALAAYRETPGADTIARMWVASRAHPRELELRIALRSALAADDPRRPALEAELIALADDPDPERALAAVLALR